MDSLNKNGGFYVGVKSAFNLNTKESAADAWNRGMAAIIETFQVGPDTARAFLDSKGGEFFAEALLSHGHTVGGALQSFTSNSQRAELDRKWVRRFIGELPKPSPRQDKLQDIAKKHLHVDTLETRHSDRDDFHDCAVWSINKALNAAYDAGRNVAFKLLYELGEDPSAYSTARLCDLYTSWCKAQGLPAMSADELLFEAITDDQRKWLHAFVEIWDHCQKVEDQKG